MSSLGERGGSKDIIKSDLFSSMAEKKCNDPRRLNALEFRFRLIRQCVFRTAAAIKYAPVSLI